MLQRLLTRRRLYLYPLAVLVGVTIGFVIFVATSDGLRTMRNGRLGGDLPAFYGAGRIVRAGNVAALYEPESQRHVQADLLPPTEKGWIHFPYPPFVAAAYTPLTLVPFKTAYVLHTVLMVLCSAWALSRLAAVLPCVRSHFWPILAATLTFYPLFRANIGGQNTAVSLLCASGAIAAIAGRRNVVAGVWLGAWLFKPQLALPAIAIVATVNSRVLPGVAIMGAVYFIIGALVSRVDWPVWWIREGVLPFATADLLVDRGNGISLREVMTELGQPILGWLLVVVVLVWAVRTARSARAHPEAYVATAAVASVLCAPHALYYDGGLAVLGAAAAAQMRGFGFASQAIWLWLLGALQPLRAYLPVPPLTVLLMAIVWFAQRTRRISLTNAAENSSRQ